LSVPKGQTAPLPANFTEASTPSTPMTIKIAVQHAVDKNPDILKAREAINQSDFDFRTAIGKLFPTISANANGNYEKDSSLLNYPNFGGNAYNQYQVFFSLNQPVYEGGALTAGLKYAKYNKDIQNYAEQVQERTTIESVIEGFYTVLLNERLYEILKYTYDLDKEILDIAKRYYKIGRDQKLDVLQFETQIATLVPAIAQQKNQIETSAASLATVLRDLDVSQLRLQGRLVAPDPKWVQSMLKKKMKELPEVSEARAQVEQSEENKTIQMAQYWPTVNVVGQIGRVAYAKTDLLQDAATSWQIGLTLTVPIFAGLSSFSERNSLASQTKQLEYAETKTGDTVSNNQIQTEKNFYTAETALETSKVAAKIGKDSLVEAEKQFKLATINYTQYQTSLQAYLTAETTYYQSEYNYIAAVAQYFDAVGIPIGNLVDELDKLSKNSKYGD
jgi:outer membrane protein